MSKPPKQPRRSSSPSFSSALSFDASLDGDAEILLPHKTSSPELRRLFEAFESAVPFSQLARVEGRGSKVVLQNIGLLNHIWANRDVTNPAMCFDKQDGRTGSRIYNPPRRGSGGVVIPCALDGANISATGAVQSINIVNNNVSLQSMQYPLVERGWMGDKGEAPTWRRPVQLTFKTPNKSRNIINKTLKDNRGRFSKKQIVSSQDTRATAPAIPLNTKGLRRLLKQWVKGDKERGLMKPLAAFNNNERNGRDPTGKSNKATYSKRRTLALATLLALQDAYENKKTFSAAIGVKAPSGEVDRLPLSYWEKVAKGFIKMEGRKMTQQEIIDLGMKLYREEVLDMLPKGDN